MKENLLAWQALISTWTTSCLTSHFLIKARVLMLSWSVTLEGPWYIHSCQLQPMRTGTPFLWTSGPLKQRRRSTRSSTRLQSMCVFKRLPAIFSTTKDSKTGDMGHTDILIAILPATTRMDFNSCWTKHVLSLGQTKMTVNESSTSRTLLPSRQHWTRFHENKDSFPSLGEADDTFRVDKNAGERQLPSTLILV